MGYILTSHTEQGILDTMRFVAMMHGSREVVVAQSAFEILQRARRHRPSLAVWDLEFCDPRETQRLSRWHEDPNLRSIPLVFLAPIDTLQEHLNSPLPQGITCLTKPVDLVELGLRIGALLDPKKEPPAPPPGHRRQIGDLVLDYNLFQVTVRGETISLTPTEFKLLRHFVEHPGQTFSSEQLLEEVWNYPPGVGSLDVVRIYVKRLRDKIEPDPRQPQYIVTIPGHGYQMPCLESSDPTPAPSAAVQASSPGPEALPALPAHPPSSPGPLQQVCEALQAVTLTCQMTLTTIMRLMDELARLDGAHATALASQGSNGAAGRLAAANGSNATLHSLRALTTQLQTTVTQLQAGWPNPERTWIPNPSEERPESGALDPLAPGAK